MIQDLSDTPSSDALFSKFPTPLAIWDLEGRVRAANSHFDRLIGYSFTEREGHSVFEFVHPDDLAIARAAFRRLLTEGQVNGFECRMRCKDGTFCWLLMSATVVPDEKLIYASAHEISRRKQAEHSLRESEAKFRSAFENPLFGMAFVALDGRFLEVNERLCRITGYSEQELLETDFQTITYPEDRATSLELRSGLIEGRFGNHAVTKRYVRGDGTIVWVLVHVALLLDARKEPLHFLILVEDLSERKQTERELRTSEEWLSLTQNSAGVGIWEWDAVERKTRASEQQFRLYGLQPSDTFPSGDEYLSLVHPDDRERLARELNRALTETGRCETRFRIVRPDGSVRWLFGRGQVQWDEAGNVIRFIGANVDITELVRAETGLTNFFESSPAALAVVDFDTRILRVNRTLVSVSGLTFEELQQRPFVQFFHKEDRPAIANAFLHIVETGCAGEMEARGLTSDGSTRWLLLTFAPALDEKRVYVTANDVTRLKLADEALRLSERRFRLIAENIEEVFWISDPTIGSVSYVSPAYERLWGRPAEALYENPRSFIDAIHPDDRDRVVTYLENKRTRLSLDQEYRIVRPDGSVVWIWDRARPVKDELEKRDLYVGIAQDITERKRMEDEIRAHSEMLLRSNAELERFAYVASHDLQEPLRMVASFTQLLSQRYSGRLDETADRYIGYAVDGAKRMQHLISELLAYSRVNSKELDVNPTDCNAVVSTAVRNLGAAIEESGSAVLWSGLPVLLADPGQLTLLFQNLLANAIKFRRRNESARVEISAEDAGVEWVFSVADNGIGIEPRHAKKIFQIFRRLHSRGEYPGTGIGLSVCEKVVERHGGRIWLDSEPGVGSTFRFALPKIKKEKRG